MEIATENPHARVRSNLRQKNPFYVTAHFSCAGRDVFAMTIFLMKFGTFGLTTRNDLVFLKDVPLEAGNMCRRLEGMLLAEIASRSHVRGVSDDLCCERVLLCENFLCTQGASARNDLVRTARVLAMTWYQTKNREAYNAIFR